ncbi:hypothetical protein AcV5_009815 [Taiwanofungus camphoratus]|nr:hypothetical protein AcV5_009815 [Antrodia cinnamomea]
MSSRSFYGGSRRGQPRSFIATSLPSDRNITEGLVSTPIETLKKPAEEVGKNIVLKEFGYLGSYNWLNDVQPTIIVPGSPPEWRDRATPYTVPRDSGSQFVDQNGYRMPSSTLLPLFRAVDVMVEEKGEPLDWTSVDFVTDRNGLRKLLRWINGTGDSVKEFRIDTQLAGRRTVLLNRWEKRVKEDADPTRFSFGHSFERESTVPAPGCEQSTGHHRIVKYDFDGLTMVVRFEVDACIAPARTSKGTSTASTVDSLSDLLSGLDVTSNAKASSRAAATVAGTELKIIRAGTEVPQSSIIELTTRSKNYVAQFDWVDAYPQLFLSQTPHHFLAAHGRGRFETITKRELGDPGLRQIEKDAQVGLTKLSSVLRTIQNLVIEHGQRGRLSLVCREGKLQVFERADQRSCLPDTEMNRFEF